MANNFDDREKKVEYKSDTLIGNTTPHDKPLHVDDDSAESKISSVGSARGIARNPTIQGKINFVDESRGKQTNGIIESQRDGSISIEANVVDSSVQTELDGALTSLATTINVDSTAGFEVSGGHYRFIIESEIVWASAKTSTSFTGCLRGMQATVAASHNSSTVVSSAPGIIYHYGDTIVDNAVTGGIFPATTNLLDLGGSNAHWRDIHTEDVWIYDRLVISANGGEGCATNFVPVVNDARNLGNSSYRWRKVYLTNAPDVASSRKIKENIVDLPYGIKEVQKLRPVHYNKIGQKKKHLGLIAEDVKEVIPEVSTGKSITYEELIPVLIRSIQELDKEVRYLKNTPCFTPWWKRWLHNWGIL